jgi:LPXTG-site transpeptidase (sortase) family protein
MNIHKSLFLLSIFIFGAGVAIAAPLSISLLEQSQALSVPAANQPVVIAGSPISDAPEVVKGSPRRISVPSLGIEVSVADGSYDAKTGQWTLSEDSAFYATPTNLINSDNGNTLIYGHNSQKIFGKLSHIQAGSKVTVTTDNGYEFTYQYTSNEAVKPTDVYALEYHGKPRLTLQTCSGVWNQTRQMFYFELKSFKKI